MLHSIYTIKRKFNRSSFGLALFFREKSRNGQMYMFDFAELWIKILGISTSLEQQ